MQEMKFLNDNIPIACIGYSFGSYVIYECACYLEMHHNYRFSHVISIAGIPLERLIGLTLYEDLPGGSDIDKLKYLFESTHGYVPSYFESKGINSMINPLKEGNK